MAADRSLVEGAYRAAMARGPKDMSKMFMQEGAMISRVAGMAMSAQARKAQAQAKKSVDKDYKESLENVTFAGYGDKKLINASMQHPGFANWSNMNPMEQEKFKQTTAMMGKESNDFATTLTGIFNNSKDYKIQEGSEGQFSNGTKGALIKFNKGQYNARWNDEDKLMIKFDGEEEVPWAVWKKNHIKLNTDEADAKTMDGIRGDVVKNAKEGLDFNYGDVKDRIIKGLFQDDIDINHFATTSKFKLPPDEKGKIKNGNFKDVLMLNPELQQEVIKNMNENELYKNMLATYDVNNIKGFDQGDLDMLMNNEKLGMYQSSMSSMVDALTNPKNPLYKTELAQDVIGDALANEVENSSHKQGSDFFNNKKDVRINNLVDAAFDASAKNNDATVFSTRKLSKIGQPKHKFEVVVKNGKQFYQHYTQTFQDGEQVYVAGQYMPVDHTQFQKKFGAGEIVENKDGTVEQKGIEYSDNYSREDHVDALRQFFKQSINPSGNPDI